MAAVAVLLSTSSIADHLDEMTRSLPPVATEDDTSIVAASIPNDTGTPPPSLLDRFVANLGAPASELSHEIDVRQGPAPEFGPEWVWHRRPTDASSSTATFADEPAGSLATHHANQTRITAMTADLGPFTANGGQAESFDGRKPSVLPGFATTLSAVVVVAMGILVGRRFDPRALRNLLKRQGKLDRREPATERIKNSEQIEATSLNLKRLSLRDMASRLKGPMSTRYRRAIMPGRSFRTSFVRKRGQGE